MGFLNIERSCMCPSNPGSSSQLWKEGRGPKEAYERKGKTLAVKYVNPSRGDVGNQEHCQIRPENLALMGLSPGQLIQPRKSMRL
jgi:hypothetical protein